jgi:hypothetical protein
VKADFFHVADEAVISREGKLSAIGIFDVIWTEAVPAVHPKLALLAHVSGALHEGSRHDYQIHFVDEDGTIVWASPVGEFELHPRGPGYPLTGGVAATLTLLVLPQFGDFAFKLLVDGEPIRTVSLAVRPLSERQRE